MELQGPSLVLKRFYHCECIDLTICLVRISCDPFVRYHNGLEYKTVIKSELHIQIYLFAEK